MSSPRHSRYLALLNLLLLLLAFTKLDQFALQGLANLHLCERLCDRANVDVLHVVHHRLGESVGP